MAKRTPTQDIWGIHNTILLEKAICKLYKFALRVSPSCSTSAIHAKTGTHSLAFDCIRSSLNYYYHITHKDPNSLTSLVLQPSFNLAISGHRSWAFLIQNQFAQLGFNLNMTQPDNTEVLTHLYNQHIQSLQSNLSCAQGATSSEGSKLRAYRLIKHDFTVCEPYLTMITNPKIRSALTNFDYQTTSSISKAVATATPANRLRNACAKSAINKRLKTKSTSYLIVPFIVQS